MQIDVIFCDDVRLEISGKHTLVGVYPAGMSYTGHLPGAIRVACWIRVAGLEKGSHHLRFVVRIPKSMIDNAGIEMDLNINNPHLPTAFHMQQFTLPITEPGDLEAFVSINGSALFKVGYLNITYDPIN